MWNSPFLLLHLLLVISVVVVIIAENRSSYKALSWIVVVSFLPILGGLLYLMFGRDVRLKGYLRNPIYRDITEAPKRLGCVAQCSSEILEDPLYIPLMNLLEADNESVLLNASDIQIYPSGKEKFAALFSDLERAQHHIHLEYYIVTNDDLGKSLLSLLARKARSGIQVRVLYDAFGSKGVGSRFWLPLKEAGGEVCGFNPLLFPYLGVQINSRNHRKIVVIDGNVGYVGGMNVALRYLKGNELGAWRDSHFRIQGTAVAGLQRAFLRDWNYTARKKLFSSCYFPSESEPCVTIPMQFFTNGPVGRVCTIERAITRAVALAKEHIYIETPYFLPTDILLNAIMSAALRGVRVCLMLPKKGDSLLTTKASNSYLSQVLLSGVEVYLYRAGFLHSKLLTIDGKLSSIGSSNMDFRSLELNYEINAFVYDRATTQRIEELFAQDLENCTRLEYSSWQQRGKAQRFFESLFRLLAPML